jgi:hypothetical protein
LNDYPGLGKIVVLPSLETGFDHHGIVFGQERMVQAIALQHRNQIAFH